MNDIREEARRLVGRLPEHATWDDVLRTVHARRAIEAGLADSDRGHSMPVAEVRRRFGLYEGPAGEVG
ncbi:MAG TPA: hypothetical protein VGR37_01345 [Longimicrobiaceae bacterium]|nr:hypothetical protein [Longimicrobiaceae bacterium]